MRRLGAAALVLLVALAAGYLGLRVARGLNFHTDLLALLPVERGDPVAQQAHDAVTRALGRRVMVLVGHQNRAQARAAASRMMAALSASPTVSGLDTVPDGDGMRRIGALYFPYRAGLLADTDRKALIAGQGEALATRALSQVFGFPGMANALLLHRDPFLLMPSFFSAMPLPASRLTPDEGMLSVRDGGITWIMVAARLAGEPFELDVQKRFIADFDHAAATLGPEVHVLKLGAVFFAAAGARQAMSETSTLGTVSTVGAILLVLLVFRRLGPLLLSLASIAVGILCGLSFSLWWFGDLHVVSLLFGMSLIGIAVDYSLYYFTDRFVCDGAPPEVRLRRVMPGLALGVLTTLVGYGALLLAPFPGLHQIAAFSAVGLAAAFASVALWVPLLDRGRNLPHGAPLIATAGALWTFWERPRLLRLRAGLGVALLFVGVAGALRLTADDDVRRLQSPDAGLLAEQHRIEALTGTGWSGQFLLVTATDDEAALQKEEALADRLSGLVTSDGLGGFQAPAGFVPSAARQRENRRLVHDRLEAPLLAAHAEKLGLSEPPEMAPTNETAPVLRLADVIKDNAVPFLADLVLEPRLDSVSHAVKLDGIRNPDVVRKTVTGLDGVRFIDPAADFSRLFGEYRVRAEVLLGLSCLLMVPLLAIRYRWRGALTVMAPPVLALLLTPSLMALLGEPITFFATMALVLVLSIGVDYAIFCAEATGARKSATLLAVYLASSTTLLSFGLLAFSGVFAVHTFGLTMLIGITLSVLLSPIGGLACRR